MPSSLLLHSGSIWNILWSEGNASQEFLLSLLGSVPGWIPAGVMASSTKSGVSDEHPKSQQSFAAKSFAVPWVWGRFAMEAPKRLSKERGQ